MTISNTLGGKRILIVEDDTFIGDDLQLELQKLGALVIGPVRDDQEAMALLDTIDMIDAAVLNIGLKGEPSFLVAARLADALVPYVFSSGHLREIVPAAFAAVPFFSKPADPKKIAEALSSRSDGGV